jgi:MoCo/4Fe-4S cofactor protein with predicted Tat translocation signal
MSSLNKEQRNSREINSAQPSSTELDLLAIQTKLREQGRGKRLWRSLEEVANTPEYQALLQSEFGDAQKRVGNPKSTLDRREMLRLMAASVAISGIVGCTRLPAEKIVPYVRQSEDIVPGRPLFYATSMPHSGMAVGLLVESHMGRPTKVEGNPQHPASLGATDIFAQASVLTLYDPDRSQAILHDGQISDWPTLAAAMAVLHADLRATKGGGFRILTECISSPSFAAQMQNLLKQLPEAKWYTHQPCGPFNARAGSRLCFGREINPVYHFDNAALIVSLDSDFLDNGPTCVRYARDFANSRNVDNAHSPMNRLYVVESMPTNTGALADHRLVMRCGEISKVARALAAALGLPVPPNGSPAPQNWLTALVNDLKQHRGESVILAGESQSPYVHALAFALNEALGNIGHTVVYTQPVEVTPHVDGLAELVSEMNAGKVSTLVILGANPVYTAPVDLHFAQSLQKVKERVHLGLYADETSEFCQWHIPQAHFLESWSDARAYDGTVGIVQPLIKPLYQGISNLEVLALFADEPAAPPHDVVQQVWRRQRPSDSDAQYADFWQQTLNDGVMAGTAFPPLSLTSKLDYGALPPEKNAPGESIELVFKPDPTVGDGRWANNAWLQELPKPLTKLTWDNALLLSPMTAWKLGVNSGDVGYFSNGPWEVVGPVLVVPGHADDSATVTLGYGRRRAGNVGSGFGLNGYLLRTSANPDCVDGLKVRKTSRKHLLATTQMHHPINRGDQQVEEESVEAFHRDLVRIGTLEEFRQNPGFAADKINVNGQSLYPPYRYEGYAWGMSIDLNRCTGCSACVMACYAENNIPVVGKYEVMAGRDMQWIRIDNYYRGDLRNPEIYFEPVPCMHCEQAPCELVCPVGATMHSSEGLNEMIYNRCVGTRYCSNNCPYKVRRFNFKLYSDWNTESLFPLRNPDVTVRSRGVMEKCTYCVQRINAAKIRSEEQDRTVRDGEIQTACQQVCPTEAIIFGNINDPNSRVSKLKAQPRNYGLLTELNTRPRTTYLAKLRNPNPEISTT